MFFVDKTLDIIDKHENRLKVVRTKKVDARNQKGSKKNIILQIFNPSNAQEDSKSVFEKGSNPLRLLHRPSNQGFLVCFFIKITGMKGLSRTKN